MWVYDGKIIGLVVVGIQIYLGKDGQFRFFLHTYMLWIQFLFEFICHTRLNGENIRGKIENKVTFLHLLVIGYLGNNYYRTIHDDLIYTGSDEKSVSLDPEGFKNPLVDFIMFFSLSVCTIWILCYM